MPESADAALREAAEWFALLNGDDASAEQRERWQRWRDADPRHASAWARVEAMRQRLAAALPAQVDRQLATRALARSLATRRQTMRRLGGLGLALGSGGVATWLAAGDPDWSPWAGDVRTAVGEQRQLALADGSRLWLNTDSAIRLEAEGPRTLRLLHGELLVAAAGEWAVQTAEGLVRAGAARFGLLRGGGRTRVSVFEGAAVLAPAAGGRARTLQAREQAAFDRNAVGPVGAVQALRESWSRGVLVAEDMRLEDLVAELARYVPGHVGCAPEVAGLRVVGAFPLADPERTFRALESALPVRVTRRWGWWTQVAAR